MRNPPYRWYTWGMDTPQLLTPEVDLERYLTHKIDATPLDSAFEVRLPSASQIDGNLWQGGTPAECGGLIPAYFEHVLCLYPWEAYSIYDGTEFRAIEMYDAPKVDGPLVRELADWVNERRAKGPTLVHCQLGLNRSGLVNAAALIRSGATADEAIALIRKARPGALFNTTFEKWLRTECK